MASKTPIRVDTGGVLYVRQKQWAATHPGDLLDNGQEVVACGTEDVLTCHVIIMREPATGVTAIAHFDEFSRVWDFREMAEDFVEKVKFVKQKSEWEYAEDGDEDDWEWWDEEDDIKHQTSSFEIDDEAIFEVHLLGGYADDAKRGHKLTQRFMHHLHNDVNLKLNIVTCCLGPPNTKKMDGQSHPIISGVHIDVITGKISPVSFNRTFTDFEGGIRDALMINISSLFKNKSSLRKMIAKQEDRGFAKSKSIKGYDNDVRRY